MRISRTTALAVVLALGAGGAAHAFDGRPVDGSAPPGAAVRATPVAPEPGAPVPPANIPAAAAAGGAATVLPPDLDGASATEAFRYGVQEYYAGDKRAALEALRIAAEKGHAVAQWKLGRMYMTGDGVDEDDAKAFSYFSEVANAHADDSPYGRQAPFVADSFVALGGYYLHGVSSAGVEPDIDRARDLFAYAASYFGDAEAQYRLGMLFLDRNAGKPDVRQAARWLHLAAIKGHVPAQIALGKLLYETTGLGVDRVQGLKWLAIARARADTTTLHKAVEAQAVALSSAGQDEQALAEELAKEWLAQNPPLTGPQPAVADSSTASGPGAKSAAQASSGPAAPAQ